MADFLIYHNPDRMRYPASKVKDPTAVTDKPIGKEVIGDRIWFVTGEGQPRTYFLVGWFRIVAVEPNFDGEFRTRLIGEWGTKLPRRSWVTLNKETWFPEFRKSQGNFAFGFQPIKQKPFVGGLENALSKAK